MNWKTLMILMSCTILYLTSGYGGEGSPETTVPTKIAEAIAVIHPTEGNTTKGVVRFSQVGDRLSIVADVEGLTPGARHGFHIHEYGDFSSPDAKSAGGHYNPEGKKHGGPLDSERHAGDLGNLEADANGKAHYERTVDNITVNGPENPILGRGVVIHGGEDDLVSQPTGNAGPRIGFGVIGAARP